MTDHPHRPDDEDDETRPTGVEIGSSAGDGTTFEPEEDPDAQAGQGDDGEEGAS